MTRAVIWDFDETLARRSGRWSDILVDVLDMESPGHSLTASSFVPSLSHGFPWHDWERGHPELSSPDRWWDYLRGVLAGALEGAGVSEPLAARALSRVRSEYIRLDRWAVFPDTEPALDRLRRLGWRQAILSNHCPELPDLVRGLGLWDYFDVILTSAAIGFEKPHPEAYARVLRDLGHPQAVWMVGDGPEVDIAGALRCGIPGVLVRRPAPGFDYAPDLMSEGVIERVRGVASVGQPDARRRIDRAGRRRIVGRPEVGPAQLRTRRLQIAEQARPRGQPFRGVPDPPGQCRTQRLTLVSARSGSFRR